MAEIFVLDLKVQTYLFPTDFPETCPIVKNRMSQFSLTVGANNDFMLKG